MNVCKCDRCGTYVDKPTIPIVRGKLFPDELGSCEQDFRIELCYTCYAQLQEWLACVPQDSRDDEGDKE